MNGHFLPISDTQPYTFTGDEKRSASSRKSEHECHATADNCMDKLKEDYDIDDSYTPEQRLSPESV
ncbi:MAG: hypothetical protein ACLR5S_04610 [Ruminococcus sp.]